MKILVSTAVFSLIATAYPAEQSTPSFDAAAAERFAKLALDCVGKEYPNKLSHSLNSDADVAPPRELTPAFFGCYDWHSSVHGHWLLTRLVRTFPDAPFAERAREALRRSLSAENLKREAVYSRAKGGRVSSGHTGWPGCCSSARNCANGMTRTPERCLRIFSRSKLLRWTACRPGCRSCRILFGSANTTRRHSRSV